MTTFTFNYEGSKYALSSDGKAKVTSGAATVDGTWTAISATEANELVIQTGEKKVAVPVRYSFDNRSKNRNALKIEVKDGDASASAIFPGTIELDDEKDVTYRLPEGGSFVLYGKLSFDGAYITLQIDLKEGKTSIRCSKPIVGQGVPGDPSKSTFLTVSAYTQVGDGGEKYPSRIGVFGNILPKEDKIVFVGTVTGNQSFDITIMGKSKAVDGALQISSDAGKLSFEGAVRYQFDEGKGTWGIMLGYSDKVFKLSADIDFTDDKTEEDGSTKLVGKATVEHDGEAFKIDVELAATFEIGQNRALQFRLNGGVVNGQLSIDFSGKVSVDDRTITASINLGEKKLAIDLGYNDDKIASTISFLKDGEDVGIRFYVEYTIGGNGKQTASAPKKAA